MATTANLGGTKVDVGQAQKEVSLNSMADLLDASIAGKLDISTTGGTTTLTGTPAAPQAQNMFLNVSGTLASNATIEIPVAAGTGRNRLYIVKNGTTGAFTLTVKKVGGTGVTVTQGTTTFLIYDGSDIAFISVGPWVSFTPTWTNLTVGNGTLVGKFAQVGKYVTYRISLVFGSTSSISGSVSVSLPVTRATYAGSAGVTPIGDAYLFDTSTGAVFEGTITNASTTTGLVAVWSASGTYTQSAVLSSTVPFTWTTGDEINVQGFYEAA